MYSSGFEVHRCASLVDAMTFPWNMCYDPEPYPQFSAIFPLLFRALGHSFPTRSLTRRSDRHQIT